MPDNPNLKSANSAKQYSKNNLFLQIFLLKEVFHTE